MIIIFALALRSLFIAKHDFDVRITKPTLGDFISGGAEPDPLWKKDCLLNTACQSTNAYMSFPLLQIHFSCITNNTILAL